MTIKDIDIQILEIFTSAKKYKEENAEIFYQIDDRTKLYLTQSDNVFQLCIYLGVQDYYHGDKLGPSTEFQCEGANYIDFQFQDDSLIINQETPWSSKLGKKVNLNSLEEIVLFLRQEWKDYNNLPKNK